MNEGLFIDVLRFETLLKDWLERKFPGSFNVFEDPAGMVVARKDGSKIVSLNKDYSITRSGTRIENPEYFIELEARLREISNA